MHRKKYPIANINNPDLLKEVESVIKDTPNQQSKIWKEKRITFRKDITGALAWAAVRQSPYAFPQGLERVVGWLDACLKQDIKWDTFGMANLSLEDIRQILYKILPGMKEFDAWNVPRKGKGNDIVFVATSIPKPPADEDFIDLDAVIKNTCIQIRDQRVLFDQFNKKFEEDHKKGKCEIDPNS